MSQKRYTNPDVDHPQPRASRAPSPSRSPRRSADAAAEAPAWRSCASVPASEGPVPPAGSQGLADQTIWSDPRARITELAFSRRALIAPQTSPDLGLFIVVAGGGWVQVGDERAAINHGEAIEWPPGVAHGAWTDGSHHARHPRRGARRCHRGAGTPAWLSRPRSTDLEPARGRLADREVRPEDHDRTEGEPW